MIVILYLCLKHLKILYTLLKNIDTFFFQIENRFNTNVKSKSYKRDNKVATNKKIGGKF